MKASVGAGILLLVLLLLVCINAVFVTNTTRSLSDQLRALPDAPSEECLQKIQVIEAYFEEKEPFLRISISFFLSDRVKEQLASLRLYAATDMAGDYLVTKALLLDAVEDMGRLERLGIFGNQS